MSDVVLQWICIVVVGAVIAIPFVAIWVAEGRGPDVPPDQRGPGYPEC